MGDIKERERETDEKATPEASPSAVVQNSQEQYLVATVGGKLYAVPAAMVGEAAALDQVYPLPLLPPYFLGLINRYSVPYAVIDMGLLITGTQCGSKKLIVLKENVDRVAFLIEDIVDIVDIDGSIPLKVAQQGVDGTTFDAVESSFEWRGQDIFVLNIPAIITRIKSDQAR